MSNDEPFNDSDNSYYFGGGGGGGIGNGTTVTTFTEHQQLLLHFTLIATACLTLLGTGSVLLAYIVKYRRAAPNLSEDGAKIIFLINLPGFIGSFFWFPWARDSNHIFCLVQASGNFKWFHIVSWGLPVASVVPCLALGLYGQTPGPWCWIMQPGIRLLIYAPGAVIVSFNIASYIYLRLHLGGKEGYDFITKRFFAFILASLICQAPSLGNRIQNYVDPDNPIFVLYLIQTIFQPLQGFINAFVYGVVDEYFWSSYTQMFCCRQTAPVDISSGVITAINDDQETSLLIDYGDGSQKYTYHGIQSPDRRVRNSEHIY
eukprot:gene15588-18519_t